MINKFGYELTKKNLANNRVVKDLKKCLEQPDRYKQYKV